MIERPAVPGPDREGPTVPAPLRAAVLVILLEALGLVIAALILLEKTIFGHPASVGRALLDVAFASFGAAVLIVGARALHRLSPSARTPIVVIELLALPVSFSLAFQAGRVGYGAPIMIAALVVLFLLFSPPARDALFREPPD